MFVLLLILDHQCKIITTTTTNTIMTTMTLSRYRRTLSVGAMLAELNWEPLASRRRTARLVFFYKVHYELVAVSMPLELKHHPGPTRTDYSLAYYIPATSVDY